MNFGSRLRTRRTNYTVSIINKSSTGSETNAYTGLKATRDPEATIETVTDLGVTITMGHTFYLEPVSGTLPTVTEAQILSDGTSRYEIIQVRGLDYMGRLTVIGSKLRVT